MRRRFLYAAAGLIFSCLGATYSWAQAPSAAWNEARLTRSENPAEKIDGLQWEMAPLKVSAKIEGRAYQPMVELHGTFDKEEWVLMNGESEISLKKGRFSWTVPLLGEITPIRLYAITPFGELRNEKAVIVFPSWSEFGTKLRGQTNPKEAIFLGIGAARIRFEQTKTRGFEGTFVVVKASYQATWKAPSLDYGFTGFLSGMPIAKSRDDMTAQFIGVNARVGYAISGIREPWRLSIMGGIYYTTMIAPFGYNHVGGPMLYPVLRRVLSDRDTVACYAKFSPITNGIQLLSLANREVATGVSWTRRRPDSNPIGLSLDVADLSTTSEGITARSRSFSVGLSYGL